MRPRWIRRARLTVGGYSISEPRLKMYIAKSATEGLAEASCNAYNLAPDTFARINRIGEDAIMEAGYGDFLSVIFKGFVERADNLRQDNANISRIVIGDLSNKAVAVPTPENLGERKLFDQEYRHQNLRDIVRDIVDNHMSDDISLGNMEAIPDIEIDHFHGMSIPRASLQQLLRAHGVAMYMDNDVMKFGVGGGEPSSEPFTGRSITVVTEADDAGDHAIMIGSAQIATDGLRITTLLEPRVEVDSAVTVRSSSSSISGTWRCISISHSADTWTGLFRTHLGLQSTEVSDE